MTHYLIIGNGAAGVSAAEVIRQRDNAGIITIITNEPYLHYSRPGIAYLINGQVTEKQLISRQKSFYQQNRFQLKLGQVTAIDTQKQTVHLANSETIPYDGLLLAAGAAAVPPPFPGNELEGVLTFDTLDDAKKVVKLGRKAKRAVVVGGGITAMELAEGLQIQGAKTYLLQRKNRIWPRLFDVTESAIIENAIRHEGIQIHYHEEITNIIGKRGKVAGVLLKSGRKIDCQIVAAAIGVRPNLELVKGLPITQDRGVLVNRFMQSNHPALFAAGDVAQVPDRWTGEHHLDILWPSAINEGRAAGYNMVDFVRGEQPGFAYKKGSPFNAALLFGVHLTVIGHLGNNDDQGEMVSHLSRGSSHVWTTPFSSSHRSAWDKDGENSVRIVLNEGRIVGALLLGNQALADPLRALIEQEVDVSRYESQLLSAGEGLPSLVLKIWEDCSSTKLTGHRQ